MFRNPGCKGLKNEVEIKNLESKFHNCLFSLWSINPLSPRERCSALDCFGRRKGLKGVLTAPFWTRGIKTITFILQTDPKLQHWTAFVQKRKFFLQVFVFRRRLKRLKKVCFFINLGWGRENGHNSLNIHCRALKS